MHDHKNSEQHGTSNNAVCVRSLNSVYSDFLLRF